MADKLVELTADIVSAYVANNTVATGDVPGIVTQVHEALRSAGTQGAAEPQGKNPVVSVRASIKPDYLVCMECGKKQTVLKRHLQTAHHMTPDQYRRDYGLPADYPMVPRAYSERRRDLANTIGLGRKRAEETSPTPKRQPRK